MSAPKGDPPALPPRVHTLVAQVQDPGARDLLARLVAAARETLHEVAGLDVLRRELPRTPAEERGLLEAARPAAAASSRAARALVNLINASYPEPESSDDDFDLEHDTVRDAPRAQDPADAARAIAWAVAHECDRMQQSLDRPAPGAGDDMWSALVELQEFRGKLRTGVGELLYQVCALHAPLQREEVIPGYRERLVGALELRRGIARFTRATLPLCEQVKSAAPAGVLPAAARLLAAVASFCGSPVFSSLRMTDRRLLDQFRDKLVKAARDARSGARAAAEVAEDLARFLEGLGAISKREVLRLHDQEAISDGIRYAAEAERDAVRVPHRAMAEFFLAERVARRLEGMEPALDAWLADSEKWPEGRPPSGVAAEAARLRAILEALLPSKPPPPPENDDEETAPGVGGA